MSSRTLGRHKGKCKRHRDPYFDHIFNRSRVDINFALEMWKHENARRKQPYKHHRRFAGSIVQKQIGNSDQQVVPMDPVWFVVPEAERVVAVQEPEELLVLVNPEALVVQIGVEELHAPVYPDQQLPPPVNPEQLVISEEPEQLAVPVNPEQLVIPEEPEEPAVPVNPEQLVVAIPAEDEEEVVPADFDPSPLIQKLLKREVSTPPSSPYSRDYFLDPPVYLDISGDDAVEISEDDFPVTTSAYSTSATTQSVSQMQSVSISAFIREDESVPNESNTATLHYQVQKDSISVPHVAAQGIQTQNVLPASQPQPLLLSQFIDADSAVDRCREIGYAAAQREISNFAALITARRTFGVYQYQDNRIVNSWQS